MDEILNLIQSVSEGFSSYFYLVTYLHNDFDINTLKQPNIGPFINLRISFYILTLI